MKKSIITAAIITATTFVANASSKSFDGAYLGAQAGFVKSHTKTAITQETYKANLATRYANPGSARNNTTGFLFGTYFGYGRTFNGNSNGALYFGGEGSLLGDTLNRTTTTNLTETTGTNTFKNTTKFKRGLVFGFAPRLGYVFGENLVYVKPGIEISRDRVEIDSTETSNNAHIGSHNKTKMNVVFAPAFGYERALGKVLVRAEYTYNLGKKVSVVQSDSTLGELGTASYQDHRFVIGAAYKF
ncbi:MAG: hypothetical protein V4544_02010 [Pseudomonadota bacterium]